MRNVVTVSVAAAALLAGCSSPAPAVPISSSPVPVASSSAPAPTPTPTPTPTAASRVTTTLLAMGTPIMDQYAKVTVVDAKPQPQGNHDLPLFGVLAQTCNVYTSAFTVSGAPWTVATDDGSTYGPASLRYGNDPSPKYPSGVVAPGQCVKGWILFEVPSGMVLSQVRYGVQAPGDVLVGAWRLV